MLIFRYLPLPLREWRSATSVNVSRYGAADALTFFAMMLRHFDVNAGRFQMIFAVRHAI